MAITLVANGFYAIYKATPLYRKTVATIKFLYELESKKIYKYEYEHLRENTYTYYV